MTIVKVPRPYSSWGEVYEIIKKTRPEILKREKNIINLSVITETNKRAIQQIKVKTLRKYISPF